MGKTLLILGNGFDLAHGLPTRYSDFLEFCNILKNLSKFRNDKALFISTNIESKKINKGIIEFFDNEFDSSVSSGKVLIKPYTHTFTKQNYWKCLTNPNPKQNSNDFSSKKIFKLQCFISHSMISS